MRCAGPGTASGARAAARAPFSVNSTCVPSAPAPVASRLSAAATPPRRVQLARKQAVVQRHLRKQPVVRQRPRLAAPDQLAVLRATLRERVPQDLCLARQHRRLARVAQQRGLAERAASSVLRTRALARRARRQRRAERRLQVAPRRRGQHRAKARCLQPARDKVRRDEGGDRARKLERDRVQPAQVRDRRARHGAERERARKVHRRAAQHLRAGRARQPHQLALQRAPARQRNSHLEARAAGRVSRQLQRQPPLGPPGRRLGARKHLRRLCRRETEDAERGRPRQRVPAVDVLLRERLRGAHKLVARYAQQQRQRALGRLHKRDVEAGGPLRSLRSLALAGLLAPAVRGAHAARGEHAARPGRALRAARPAAAVAGPQNRRRTVGRGRRTVGRGRRTVGRGPPDSRPRALRTQLARPHRQRVALPAAARGECWLARAAGRLCASLQAIWTYAQGAGPGLNTGGCQQGNIWRRCFISLRTTLFHCHRNIPASSFFQSNCSSTRLERGFKAGVPTVCRPVFIRVFPAKISPRRIIQQKPEFDHVGNVCIPGELRSLLCHQFLIFRYQVSSLVPMWFSF